MIRPVGPRRTTQPARRASDLERVGFIHVEAEIRAPLGEGWERLSLLVDTGAMLSIVPRPILEKLGITEHKWKRFTLADGSAIERGVGMMVVRLRGETSGTDVIFGEPNDQQIIGVTALEQLGFLPNPLTGELEPIEMLLAGFRGPFPLAKAD